MTASPASVNPETIHPRQRSKRSTLVMATTMWYALYCGCVSTNSVGIADPSPATLNQAHLAATGAGGGACPDGAADLMSAPPAELNKVTMPTYRVEPPDVLLIEGIRMAPKSPYFISYQDILQIVASGTLPDQPIAATFQVDSAGRVDLGPSYGSVRVEGLTLTEASHAISQQLRLILQVPDVSVTLIQPAGQQLISGEHLVAPDGTINLGIYGLVYINGMTVDEARAAIEEHLGQHFDNPSVSVEVFGYQSKFYYVITEGPGDSVYSVPATGNDTVLDAIARLGGLGQLSNKRIWISRPVPHGVGCDQILPVDWIAITKGANAATNYQLLPGDRVFVAADRFAMLDEMVARVIFPFERLFGFTLLGAQTVQSLQRFPAGTF